MPAPHLGGRHIGTLPRAPVTGGAEILICMIEKKSLLHKAPSLRNPVSSRMTYKNKAPQKKIGGERWRDGLYQVFAPIRKISRSEAGSAVFFMILMSSLEHKLSFFSVNPSRQQKTRAIFNLLRQK